MLERLMLPVWLKYKDNTVEMDAGHLFSVLSLSSLQSSSWGDGGLWSVPSVPECPTLLVWICLARWWFCIFAPNCIKWFLKDLNAFCHCDFSTDKVVCRMWRSTQQTPRIMSQIVRVHIWKNIVCEIMKTLSIYPCSNVFIQGRPLVNVFLLFSLHCDFLPKANAALMENANEKSIKTYCWF